MEHARPPATPAIEPVGSSAMFIAASRKVLRVLKDRVGLDSWFVTRVQNGQLVALVTLGWATDGQAATALCPVSDSCCHRMLAGAPRCAPDVRAVDAYRHAPIFETLDFGAYLGVPLRACDGAVVGTLCAVHGTAVPEAVRGHMPLIELQGELLSMLLSAELEADRNRRRAEQAEAASTHDCLTGLHNRRAWDVLLEAEEARCRRYAHLACVFSIDLDDLKWTNDTLGHAEGDVLLRRSADALRSAVRTTDAVARLGGDEFAVLCPECDAVGARMLHDRLAGALATAGVRASIGMGLRDVQGTLRAAAGAADVAMYDQKRARKIGRGGPYDEWVAV